MHEFNNFVEEYNVDIEYSDFEEDEKYFFEDIVIPIRRILERKYPQALDEIIEADKKLIKGYESLPDGSYLKEILTPIYELALKNVKREKAA